MPEMRLAEFTGFRVWASMLINNEETYAVEDANAQLQFYRADDTAYLVVNVFVGDRGVIEYVFLPDKDIDKPRTAELVFDFLKGVGFNLHDLLLWLANAPYVDGETGDEVVTGGLKITREINEC